MNDNRYIELLKQYQAGTISDTDRHILERAALDDPFLFDAMEGYGMYGSTGDTQSIQDLKNTNSKKEGKVRWINLRSLTVAASLIALLGITFLVKNQVTETSNHREHIASKADSEERAPVAEILNDKTKNETDRDKPNTVTLDEDIDLDQETATTDVDNTTVQTKPTTIQSSPLSKPDNHEEPLEEMASMEINESEMPSAPIEASEAESIETLKETSTASRTETNKKRIARPEKDAIDYADTEDDTKYILGKVLDSNGQIIQGASVMIENTEIQTDSDISGNFKLPKYESGHQLVIKANGFQSQKIVLGDINYYQVVLRPSERNDTEKNELRPLEVRKDKAYPSMGMEEFEIYVEDNINFPLEIFGTTKSGHFKVSFIVNGDGSLSDFIDENGNCDECFKEAVRLLKGSGKWNTKPANQIYKTSYDFEF